METTTGIIDVVSQKPKNYGLRIGDEWFNGYGQTKYKKGDKVELGWEFNEEYNSNSIKEHKLLEASTEPESKFKPKRESNEFRVNVDAGNLVQRQIELLNGCEDLTFKEKLEIITNGSLIEQLTKNFKKAITLLEEDKTSPASVKPIIVSADGIPNKEEMIKQFDKMEKQGDIMRRGFK